MSGLLSLLLFAAFFYLMMRFGCGAHMVHGHHPGHGPGAGEGLGGSTGRDPVCGMQVHPGQGYAKLQDGREYRFCSRKCLDQFEADPGRYISSGRS
ncbi:MAG: YHS domain-containing protein [Acidobacteriia bacterium]|nr:YHS domain-containing protein [Terriglobia bacterium]